MDGLWLAFSKSDVVRRKFDPNPFLRRRTSIFPVLGAVSSRICLSCESSRKACAALIEWQVVRIETRIDGRTSGEGSEGTDETTLRESGKALEKSESNSISGVGGGISTFANSLTVINSTISQNFATDRAGGIYAGSGTITMSNSSD